MNSKTKHVISNMEDNGRDILNKLQPQNLKERFHFRMPSRKVLFTTIGAIGLIGAGVAYQLYKKQEAKA